MDEPLLSVENVSVRFKVGRSLLTAVDDVSLQIEKGGTIGLVGESGSGKSTLGLTIVGAHDPDAGRVVFDGKDRADLTQEELRRFHTRVQMIFQDPYSSLDPQMKVGAIIAEPLKVHRLGSRDEIAERVGQLLEEVGLFRGAVDRYPTQFSGGQRQRISIARALALRPWLLIADEPVSALDVSIQAQVIRLLGEVKEEFGLTTLVIAHDLALVYQITDRMTVMYLGQVVEEGPTEDVVFNPQHPYTASLLSATPIPDPGIERTRARIILHGEPPSALTPPPGCRFHTRCPIAQPICSEQSPPLVEVGAQRAACFFPGELGSLLHSKERTR